MNSRVQAQNAMHSRMPVQKSVRSWRPAQSGMHNGMPAQDGLAADSSPHAGGTSGPQSDPKYLTLAGVCLGYGFHVMCTSVWLREEWLIWGRGGEGGYWSKGEQSSISSLRSISISCQAFSRIPPITCLLYSPPFHMPPHSTFWVMSHEFSPQLPTDMNLCHPTRLHAPIL